MLQWDRTYPLITVHVRYCVMTPPWVMTQGMPSGAVQYCPTDLQAALEGMGCHALQCRAARSQSSAVSLVVCVIQAG